MTVIGLFSETGTNAFSRGRWRSPQLGLACKEGAASCYQLGSLVLLGLICLPRTQVSIHGQPGSQQAM